jgi:hypothetical protein
VCNTHGRMAAALLLCGLLCSSTLMCLRVVPQVCLLTVCVCCLLPAAWLLVAGCRERGWKLKQAKRFVRAVKASKLDVESRAEVRQQQQQQQQQH